MVGAVARFSLRHVALGKLGGLGALSAHAKLLNPARQCLKLVQADGLQPDGLDAREQRLDVALAALLLIEAYEVVEARGDQRMVRPEGLLADGKRLLEQMLGVGVALLRRVEPAEPSDGRGVFRIALATRLSRKVHVALGERRGLGFLALGREISDPKIDLGKFVRRFRAGRILREEENGRRDQRKRHEDER
ncbi:hypothetical protein AUC69_08340 [Methyloceanibacter superfactus]|uniref:Uncharacterized protein n=1 Tax=Methyloceanibacter superfactus TaxID=1774969 RepID=A0A1E3W1E5_9HYPH|nr:hypothetical protein AUC69_08340 [Methyloceanibacter superfactus]